MKEINIGFYLIVVGVSFTIGGILGGLIVHFIGKFFREMQEEMELKEKIDEMEGR